MIEYRIRIEKGGVTVTQRIESASKVIRKVHPKDGHDQDDADEDRDGSAAMGASTASNASGGAASPVTPVAHGADRSMSLPSKYPHAAGSHPVPAPDECACPVAIVFGPIILFGSLDDVVGGPEDKSGTGS